MAELHRGYGLETRYGPSGLEVKGYEPLRGVKTPRQEQIAAELGKDSTPRTPKALAYASRKTHGTGNRKWGGAARAGGTESRAARVADAVRKTAEWLKSKGMAALRAARAKVRSGSAGSRGGTGCGRPRAAGTRPQKSRTPGPPGGGQ
jgi:hypothetical protein